LASGYSGRISVCVHRASHSVAIKHEYHWCDKGAFTLTV